MRQPIARLEAALTDMVTLARQMKAKLDALAGDGEAELWYTASRRIETAEKIIDELKHAKEWKGLV